MNFDNNFFLAKRLCSGDSKAYDFLVDTHYHNLCVYAYNLVNDHGKAEDIVQNVFAEIWITRKKINAEFSIRSLLYKSVYNEYIDGYRRNKPVIYLEKKHLEAIDLVVENDQENFDEILRQLDLEVNNLPRKCKRIFLLNKKEGLTHMEISEYLGVSIKNIEAHMTRAFKILSERLGEKYEINLFLLYGSYQN